MMLRKDHAGGDFTRNLESTKFVKILISSLHLQNGASPGRSCHASRAR